MPDSPGMAAPRRSVRLTTWSVVRAVLAVAGCALLVTLARAAETPLWWVAIAAVIAALLSPVMLRLSRLVPRPLAIIIVLVGTTVFGVFVVYKGLSEVAAQVDALRTEAVQVAHDYETSEQYGEVAGEFALTDKVRTFFDSLPVYVGGGDTTDAVNAVTSNAGGLLAIFFLMLLLIVSGERMVRGAVAQVAEGEARERTLEVLRAAYGRTSRYLGLLVLRALVVGVVVSVMASLAGWPAGTVIGLWFALWSMVPGVGLVVAAGPICVAIAIASPVWAGVALVVVMAAQYGLTLTVDRWIEDRVLQVGAALTLLAAAVGIELYGLGGALIMVYAATLAVALGHELATDTQSMPDALRDLVRAPTPG